MIRKIISGGEIGVEQAALDSAIKTDIACGGWITTWQKQDLGKKADLYGLREMPDVNYARTAEHNVREADGVLIISRSELIGNAALHRRIAQRYGRPCLYIDLNKITAFGASEQIRTWILEHRIRMLDVTGPLESDDMPFYQATRDILETVFLMLIADAAENQAMAADERSAHLLSDFVALPKTIEEAADKLAERLTFREKTKIANMKEHKLDNLVLSLSPFVRSEFRLDTNDELKAACRRISGSDDLDVAIEVIIGRMWRQLQKANVLRVVKR